MTDTQGRALYPAEHREGPVFVLNDCQLLGFMNVENFAGLQWHVLLHYFSHTAISYWARKPMHRRRYPVRDEFVVPIERASYECTVALVGYQLHFGLDYVAPRITAFPDTPPVH